MTSSTICNKISTEEKETETYLNGFKQAPNSVVAFLRGMIPAGLFTATVIGMGGVCGLGIGGTLTDSESADIGKGMRIGARIGILVTSFFLGSSLIKALFSNTDTKASPRKHPFDEDFCTNEEVRRVTSGLVGSLVGPAVVILASAIKSDQIARILSGEFLFTSTAR
jgi:hypothetical protein